MPVYQYRARDWDGAERTGTICARDEASARDTLRRQDLYVTGMEPERKGPHWLSWLASLFGGRRASERRAAERRRAA